MEAEETMECLQEFPEHHKMILDRLNEQREQDRFTDITLIVDGHHFKAHKAVLAACSKFFYKFFQEFTQEPLVEIEDKAAAAATARASPWMAAAAARVGPRLRQAVDGSLHCQGQLETQAAAVAGSGSSRGMMGVLPSPDRQLTPTEGVQTAA
ncbi:Zinc finger protein 131 [Myotis davidii]|uniref:Zinc finger protein 131 n=1 Tax=Myotis davidii TaxID=225400 RepID=L5LJV4_MYODS|nr:Zinc finger protein 131 [Myotis davidii]